VFVAECGSVEQWLKARPVQIDVVLIAAGSNHFRRSGNLDDRPVTCDGNAVQGGSMPLRTAAPVWSRMSFDRKPSRSQIRDWKIAQAPGKRLKLPAGNFQLFCL
jgi:hypothetical protein